MALIEEKLMRLVIDAFHRVYDRLGYGYAESVYVSALVHELERLGLKVQREVPVSVGYDGRTFGVFRADLMVEGRIILEVKADISPGFGAQRQLLNYLRCSDLKSAYCWCSA